MSSSCCTIHVSLLAGQSNALGRFDSAGLTGLNTGFITPYHGVQFAEQNANLTTAAIEYDYPLGPVVAKETNQRMGPELSLARMIAMNRGSDWQPCDEVALLKFAVGGATLNQFRTIDTSGVHDAFMLFLTQKMADLNAKYCNVVCHDLFWVQGESDRNSAGAADYVTRFQDFESTLSTICDFRTVFSQLQENVTTLTGAGDNQGDMAEIINANMLAAGYAITVNNDDLSIGDVVHYTPDSYVELGRRLANAVT